MESQLKDIYSEALAGVTEKWNQYMSDQDAYVKDLQDAYWTAKRAGFTAEAKEIGKQLGVAKAERTVRNKKYKETVDQTTERLAHVNKVALDYVNGQLPEIYAINYNQAAETADQVGVSFSLVNESVVKRMVKDGDIELPKKKLDIPKDKRWNTKQLNSSVLQGILQGESMDKIANRILPIVGRNESAAIRNARTMVTGAENRGRLDSYKQLEEDGLVLKKVWMATPDGRTRDWHIDMDGQEVGVDENFVDGLGNELEYPGDPGGAPETVYNCRCTMVTDVKGFRRSDGSISYIDYEPEGESFHEQQMREEQARREKSQKEEPIKTVRVTNREQAYGALSKMFGSIEENVKVIDEELLCENVNRLIELNEKFKVLTSENVGYITTSKDGRAMAWTNTSFRPNPRGEFIQRVNLSLVGSYYRDKQFLYNEEKDSVKRFWSMPCKEENYTTYSLCHEFGHMLESKIAISRTDYDKIKEKLDKMVNPSAAQMKKPYEEAEKKCAKDIYGEILQIAKDKNPEFKVRENLSEYGRSNHFEAFAEIFANSQCGEPNEFGDAMNEWLKKEGY